jgi:hypothetical protein
MVGMTTTPAAWLSALSGRTESSSSTDLALGIPPEWAALEGGRAGRADPSGPRETGDTGCYHRRSLVGNIGRAGTCRATCSQRDGSRAAVWLLFPRCARCRSCPGLGT